MLGSVLDEAVVLPIEDTIDLHSFRPDETAPVLEDYLEAAATRGFFEVRVIHGRGRGVQRAIARAVVRRSPHVVSFRDARPDSGGWGATVVQLRRPLPLRET